MCGKGEKEKSKYFGPIGKGSGNPFLCRDELGTFEQLAQS